MATETIEIIIDPADSDASLDWTLIADYIPMVKAGSFITINGRAIKLDGTIPPTLTATLSSIPASGSLGVSGSYSQIWTGPIVVGDKGSFPFQKQMVDTGMYKLDLMPGSLMTKSLVWRVY